MSEWEDIRDNIIAKIEAITPTIEPTKTFSHTGGTLRIWAQSRGYTSAGLPEIHRKFDVISDNDDTPTGKNYGLTSRELQETLVVMVGYHGEDRGALDVVRKSDAKDIRNALLNPHVTFPDALGNIQYVPGVLLSALVADGHQVVTEHRYLITYDEAI